MKTTVNSHYSYQLQYRFRISVMRAREGRIKLNDSTRSPCFRLLVLLLVIKVGAPRDAFDFPSISCMKLLRSRPERLFGQSGAYGIKEESGIRLPML